jgi:Zn-dependent protease with chaperone function
MEQAQTSKECGDGSEQSDVFGTYMASHPATSERIKALEQD